MSCVRTLVFNLDSKSEIQGVSELSELFAVFSIYECILLFKREPVALVI